MAYNSHLWDTLGYAIYKISCTCVYPFFTQTTYFYLDWCDDRYDTIIYPNKDFGINFNEEAEENRFSYAKWNKPIIWTTIKDSSVVGVWEILGVAGSPSRMKFQPTTPTNLHYENANGHPRLSWNLSEPQEAATYEVWRKVCSNPPKYSVIVEDWRWVQSLPAGTNNWTDNDFQISGTVNQASYRVRAVSGDGHLYSPSFSNTVTIAGEFLPFDRQPAPTVSLKPNNPSLAIFPNPFNSTLKITIDAPAEPITEMVICDLRSRAVRRWVSLANPHQVITTWDGRDEGSNYLQLGIYLMQMRNGKKSLL